MPLNNTTIPILRGNKQKAHPLQSGNQQRHQSSPRFDEVVDKRSSVFVCEAPVLPTISRTLSLVGVAGSPRHLQGAASIAGLLITTEAMVAERPKKEAAHPPMPGGGMGGMDY